MTTASIAGISVERIAAFSDGEVGGNPAGVAICETLPDIATMQAIAADLGYAETVFAAPIGSDWRVRYFAPAVEIPFCGHATIALGAAFAFRFGAGTFRLQLNEAQITVEGHQVGSTFTASLQSPPTRSRPATPELTDNVMRLFSFLPADLDERIPPAIAEAGAKHFVLALNSRERLAAMHYNFNLGRALMSTQGWATISLIFAESRRLLHARNPFAGGGLYEDPATGAAAAALAGYLRDLHWPHGGMIEIIQGEDMGMRSRLRADISAFTGSSIRVSGDARFME